MTDIQKKIFVTICTAEGFNYIDSKLFVEYAKQNPEKLLFTDEFMFAKELGCLYRSDFFFGLNNKVTALEIAGGSYLNSGGGHRSISGFLIGMEKSFAYFILGIHHINCEMKVFDNKPISLLKSIKTCLGFEFNKKKLFEELYDKSRKNRAKAVKSKKK